MGDNSDINDGTTTNDNNVTTMTPEEIAQKIQEALAATNGTPESEYVRMTSEEIEAKKNMTQEQRRIEGEAIGDTMDTPPGLDNGLKSMKRPNYVKILKRILNM